jgi:hypothetical protein
VSRKFAFLHCNRLVIDKAHVLCSVSWILFMSMSILMVILDKEITCYYLLLGDIFFLFRATCTVSCLRTDKFCSSSQSDI